MQSPLSQLGGDATLDAREAHRIIGDSGSLTHARDVWSRFVSLDGGDPAGEAVVSAASLQAALAFGMKTPAQSLAGRYPAYLLPGNTALTHAECQTAPHEIAARVIAAVGGTGQAKAVNAAAKDPIGSLERWMHAFSGSEKATADDMARGLLALRELYGASRRWNLINDNAAKQRVSLSELYALARLEATLALPPPATTFDAGPLAPTSPDHGDCRTSATQLPQFTRPGWVFCIQATNSDAVANAVDVRAWQAYLAETHLIQGFGMDVAGVASHLPSADDELKQVFDQATRLSGGSSDPFLENVRRALPELADVVLGMARLSLLAATQGQAIATLATAVTLALEFVDAHVYGLGAATPGGGMKSATMYLRERDDGAAARLCYELQALMYGACSRPATLLCQRDRVGETGATVGQSPRFTPYLTYLRFHIGDQAFVQALGHAADRLKRIRAEWHAVGGKAWASAATGHALRLALDKALAQAHYQRKPFAQTVDALDRIRRNPPDAHDDIWHHIGLVDRLHSEGVTWPQQSDVPADPRWLSRNSTTADAIAGVLVAVQQQNLLPALSVALQFTPPETLAKLHVIPSKRAAGFRDAHVFARLEEGFAAAAT